MRGKYREKSGIETDRERETRETEREREKYIYIYIYIYSIYNILDLLYKQYILY